MTAVSDFEKNVTVGAPDGPLRFVESLGLEVPTFLDPRIDLVHPKANGIKYVDYHIPFKMRGMYRPDNLPTEFYNKRKGRIQVNMEGFVLCTGTNAQGFPCSNPATNRSLFCRNHGGALHPLDKKISPATNQMGLMAEAESKAAIDKLDRVQRFMQGYLTVEELDDDEITGAYVRNSDGQPISNTRLGVRFQQDMVKELARRMNKFMQMKLPNMLKVVTDIAESEIVEPQDRIKAAIWAAERVMGKTPEVIIHGKTEAGYEAVFENMQTGSREAYRSGNHVSSTRAIEAGGLSENEIYDAEEVFDNSEEVFDNDSSVQNEQSVLLVEEGIIPEQKDEGISRTIESDYSVQPPDKVQNYVSLESKRAEIQARRNRLKKAKAKRFAARAAGVATLADTPWALLWIKRSDGTHRCRIIRPENMTPALFQKLELQKQKDKESENA